MTKVMVYKCSHIGASSQLKGSKYIFPNYTILLHCVDLLTHCSSLKWKVKIVCPLNSD